jgi:hypothetical protein
MPARVKKGLTLTCAFPFRCPACTFALLRLESQLGVYKGETAKLFNLVVVTDARHAQKPSCPKVICLEARNRLDELIPTEGSGTHNLCTPVPAWFSRKADTYWNSFRDFCHRGTSLNKLVSRQFICAVPNPSMLVHLPLLASLSFVGSGPVTMLSSLNLRGCRI